MADKRPAIYVHRLGETLRPESAFDAELLREFDANKRLRAVLSMPRNTDRLRFYFACLNLVRENMDNPPPKQMLHDAIKMRLGFTHTVKGVGGDIVLPDSVAFDAMEEGRFKEFLEDFKRFVVTNIIPGMNSAEFEAAAMEMLGGRR